MSGGDLKGSFRRTLSVQRRGCRVLESSCATQEGAGQPHFPQPLAATHVGFGHRKERAGRRTNPLLK